MRTFLACAAVIVALLAWLFPFHPISQSPFTSKLSTPPASLASRESEARRVESLVDLRMETQRVTSLLEDWASKIRDHDLDGHMAFYAVTVEPFYKKQSCGSDQVRAELSPAFSRYGALDVHLSNIVVNVDSSGRQAVATFKKRWNFQGETSFSGVVKQTVWLLKQEGRWQISGINEQ